MVGLHKVRPVRLPRTPSGGRCERQNDGVPHAHVTKHAKEGSRVQVTGQQASVPDGELLVSITDWLRS